jgi:hypothetical protein
VRERFLAPRDYLRLNVRFSIGHSPPAEESETGGREGKWGMSRVAKISTVNNPRPTRDFWPNAEISIFARLFLGDFEISHPLASPEFRPDWSVSKFRMDRFSELKGPRSLRQERRPPIGP